MSKRPKVLVVDSDLHALSKIYLSLIHKDYRVEATDDGGEILSRLERFRPRLLILNPGTRNLTDEIWQELNRMRLRVLLLIEKDGQTGVPLKRSERLDLPVDMGLLDQRIREMLDILD